MQKILIVDDHPLYREGMMSALRAQMGDVEVLGTDSAEEGLRMLACNPGIDLVLIDVRLPGMDGFAALSVYGARFPTISRMLVSGSEEPRYLKRAFAAGASVYIPKSMPVREVTAAIRRVLDVDALRGKVIAVIDDERDVREGLAELLGMWRCKPVAAASLRELLDRLEASGSRPDAVIADYRLREHESGAGAIAALRARYGAALPALIMSGDTTPEIFQVAREQHLPLLSKPVRAARLRAALQHLLTDSREAARAEA